jgi:uncharacterized protein DUF5684
VNFVSQLAQSSYYDQDMTSTGSSASAAVIIFTLLFSLVVLVAVYIMTSLLLSRIFKKAGIEGWKAWVPIYNNWVTLELGGQKGYWAVLAFIPILNIVAAVFVYIAMYNIGLNFGKDGVFVLFAIFIPLVWYIWLAFDSSTWKGPQQAGSQRAYVKNDPGTPTKPSK